MPSSSYIGKDLVYASARDLARYLDLVNSGRDPIDEEDDDGEIIPDGPLLTEVHAHLQSGSHADALKTLSPHAADVVSGKVKAVDARFAVRALASLASLCGREKLSPVISAVEEAAGAGRLDKALALEMICDMCNHCPDHADPCRALALGRALAFAAANGLGEMLRQEAASAERNIADWSMTPEDTRAVYRSLAAIHEPADPSHLRYLTLFLSTFESGSSLPEDVVVSARRACLVAVSQTSARHSQLLSMPAIAALGASGSAAESLAAHSLLRVFATGTRGDFDTLLRTDPQLSGRIAAMCESEAITEGMGQGDLERRITLLTLAGMAATDAGELSYAEIAGGLGVAEDAVEDWVIDAIGEGVIEGRMDQLQRRVVIKRALPRTFDPARAWPEIAGKAREWVNNVDELLKIIKVAREKRANAAVTNA